MGESRSESDVEARVLQQRARASFRGAERAATGSRTVTRAPAVSAFHDSTFFRSGMTAAAPRSAALVHANLPCPLPGRHVYMPRKGAGHGFLAFAGVRGPVRCPATVCLQTVRGGRDAADLLIRRNLVEPLGQHPSPVHPNRWRSLARRRPPRCWSIPRPGFPGLARRSSLSAKVPFACQTRDVDLAPDQPCERHWSA